MNGPLRHPSLAIEMIDLSALRPYAKNARCHSRAQIKQIAKSIEVFGFTNPILVGDDIEIFAGHGRAAAAQLIGMKQAPIVRLSDLSPAEKKAYVLADNKLALNAGWDREVLAGPKDGLGPSPIARLPTIERKTRGLSVLQRGGSSVYAYSREARKMAENRRAFGCRSEHPGSIHRKWRRRKSKWITYEEPFGRP